MNIKNVTLDDQGDLFETGLLAFSPESVLANLTVDFIKAYKKQYFSTLIRSSSAEYLKVTNIEIIPTSSDLKSQKL